MDAAQGDNLLFSPTMVHQNTSSVRTQSSPAILPPATALAAMEGSKKALDISSLMSPPELPPYETFSHSALSATPGSMRRFSLERPAAPNPPLSPPISPFTKSTNCIDPIPTLREESQDPILYPNVADISPTPSQQPLFKASDDTPEIDLEAKRRVDQHLATRPSYLFQQTTPPEREEYELALYFKSTVMQSYTQNPSGWLRKERAILMADKRASMKAAAARARLQPILPAKAATRPSTSRVSKPKPILPTYRPIVAPANAAATVAGRGPRVTSGPLPKMQTAELPPRQRRESAAARKKAGSTTPEPRSKPVGPNREDKDFEALPDYCPPLSSLPENRPNCLKVDWKGNALDLTNDPHVGRLHPDERLLAAGLRLDCATYLTSKRRIFMRRLECARIGKEFRKTDAQQACKIDVNKASKLWTAYDRVHWLDISWMQKFI